MKHSLMKKIILLDLDDTLIETTFRQYEVIKAYFDQTKIKISSFDEYQYFRSLNKSSNLSYVNLFTNDEILINHFKSFYLENIESDLFLNYDRLIVEKMLMSKVSNHYYLILISLRSNTENSINQLKKLKLLDIFQEVYFLKHNSINPKINIISTLKSKHEILSFAADSISDFEAAKSNDVEFIGVKTGLFKINGKFQLFNDINEYFRTLI